MSRQPILAAALLAAACLAHAADAPGTQTVTVSGTHKIALPASPYKVTSAESGAVLGQYALANGKTLTVAGKPGHLTAEMEGMARADLVAASATTFVARNQQMSLTFDAAENGVVSGVVVTYLAPVETRGQRRAK